MAEKVSMNTIVEVRDVSKCYGGKMGRHGHTESMTRALDHVNFSVDQGEFVAIMGPSGSGKSTLLNCLATIDTPTNGHIIIGGKDVVGLSSKELARFRREELGFVFQDSNLLDTLTIRENIALALTISRVPARTITKPHLILADEPTGALDTKSARELLDALEFLHALGATILMVTHDSSVASHSDRIVFIRDGRLWGQMSRSNNDRKTFLARIIAATSQLEEGEENAC